MHKSDVKFHGHRVRYVVRRSSHEVAKNEERETEHDPDGVGGHVDARPSYFIPMMYALQPRDVMRKKIPAP